MRYENIFLRNMTTAILILVGFVGFALSFETLWHYATAAFGAMAIGFPLLADLLIVGCLLQYIRTAQANAPMNEWRLAAHAAVAGTIFLNVIASPIQYVPLHAVPPVVWSVLCELVARQVLGQYRRSLPFSGEQLTLRLWITAPRQSAQTWLRHARITAGESWVAVATLNDARSCVNAYVDDHAVRRVLRRQLRAGSLAPSELLHVLCLTPGAAGPASAEAALRAALRASLSRVTAPVSLGIEAPSVTGQRQSEPIEIPAPKATKRTLIETVLTRVGGDRTAAMAMLDSMDVQYTDGYVHRIAREMNATNSKVTVLHR